ncbi:DUF2637 domain-containing protein [Nocardia takedensis]|uniref:DUF2637 domain-containing protein n=1 Tax=Nocardia takedensis TaxID=259390 RepID=UPI000684EAD3|nr:DUF2637 domain-containing protein [Nocardia takedensis]
MAADQRLSGAGMRWARWSAAVIIVAVGVAAFRLSFTTLADLAVLARVPARDAWLFPLIVDGTILLATFGVLVSPGRSERRFFLAVLVIGAAVSVAGNSLHAVASGHPLPGWAAAIVAAVAPISLLADTHGLALLFRASQRSAESVVVPVSVAGELASTDPVPVPPADPAPAPAPVPVPVPVPVRRAKPVRKPSSSRRDPAVVARAVELRAAGKSFAEIARELGVSAATAAKYAKSATPKPAVAEPVPAPESTLVPEPAPLRVAAAPVPVARVVPVRPSRPVHQPMLPIAIPAGSH